MKYRKSQPRRETIKKNQMKNLKHKNTIAEINFH